MQGIAENGTAASPQIDPKDDARERVNAIDDRRVHPRPSWVREGEEKLFGAAGETLR